MSDDDLVIVPAETFWQMDVDVQVGDRLVLDGVRYEAIAYDIQPDKWHLRRLPPIGGRIDHPLVLTSRRTCPGWPDQYEGILTDGYVLYEFYLRYRYGRAELGIGRDQEAAVLDTINGAQVCEEVGDEYAAVFESDAERDEVFARLLGQRLAEPA